MPRTRKPSFYAALSLVFVAFLCVAAKAQTIKSPGGRLSLTFALGAEGEPTYQLSMGSRPVIRQSRLGVELRDAPGFVKGFGVAKAEESSFDETWEPVWGEVRRVRNNYRELAVTLEQAAQKGRRLVIRFRLFDDGLGFRYEF